MNPCAHCPGGMPGREQHLVQLGVNPDTFDVLIALAGNPNTGKSTVFNALTGLRQHTGNWPGKTVARAEGTYRHAGKRMKILDLPGTYSLQAATLDEEVARDFLLFGRPDVTVVVVDATRLERNLNLVIQVLEVTDRVVVCLNLMDEARRHGLAVDAARLAQELGVPVVPTSARRGEGIPELIAAIARVASGTERLNPFRMAALPADVEAAISQLAPAVEATFPGIPNARWVALRLLNADGRVEEAVRTGVLLTLARVEGGRDGAAPEAESERAEAASAPPVAHAAAPAAPRIDAAGGPNALPGEGAADAGADGQARHALLARAQSLRWGLRPDVHDELAESIYAEARRISEASVLRGLSRARFDFDRTLDRVLTSKVTGFPAMLALLALVFWITITGANYPSALLASLLIDTVHPLLKSAAAAIGSPAWLSGLVLDGVYLATAWVTAVMLPPMAIFFPLFTLLEDFGYLPRVAFNLDRFFRAAGAHGKQALTMCMGYGCNAAGVVATRIIDSPRERLVAIITNNFALCNGRWPTQILIASVFIGSLAPPSLAGVVSAAAVVAVVLVGVAFTFLSSWLLTRTVLRGEAATFSLGLPPSRPPRILATLYTSLIDRTLIVLWRAIVFAAPAGAIIWLISNVHVGGAPIAAHAISWLNPLGLLIGLNGVILLAYIVAIPANEIVIPTVLMLTTLVVPAVAGQGAGAGVMFELDSESAVREILAADGWTLLTAVCLMLFSLLHNPCSTTIYTIYKETGSARWTAVATLLPIACGFVVCFLVAQVWRLAAGA